MERYTQIAIGILALTILMILILARVNLPDGTESLHLLTYHLEEEHTSPLDKTEITETDPEKIIVITQNRLKALEVYGISLEDASKYNCIKFLFKDRLTSTHTYSVTSKTQNTTGTMQRQIFETQVGSTEYIAIERKTSLKHTRNNETFTENTIVTSYSLLNATSCIFKKEIIDDEGRLVQVNRLCKSYERDGSYKTCFYNIELVGKEVLELPAGVFNTTVFRVPTENTTYWDAGLSFPVKFEKEDFIYELADYESQ